MGKTQVGTRLSDAEEQLLERYQEAHDLNTADALREAVSALEPAEGDENDTQTQLSTGEGGGLPEPEPRDEAEPEPPDEAEPEPRDEAEPEPQREPEPDPEGDAGEGSIILFVAVGVLIYLISKNQDDTGGPGGI